MLALTRLQTLTRRHRRGLAALLAGAAMLFALGSLRAAPAASSGSAPDAAPALHAGEVAVPVTLASPAIAAVLAPGDVVDLVAAAPDEAVRPVVLTSRARVMGSATSSGFGGPGSAVVLLAVPEDDALEVSAAIDRTLTVIVRSG